MHLTVAQLGLATARLAPPSTARCLDALAGSVKLDPNSLPACVSGFNTPSGAELHHKILERAGLIVRGQEAQYRPCALNPAPLQVMSAWAEQYQRLWETRLDRMDDYLAQLRSQRHKDTHDG